MGTSGSWTRLNYVQFTCINHCTTAAANAVAYSRKRYGVEMIRMEQCILRVFSMFRARCGHGLAHKSPLLSSWATSVVSASTWRLPRRSSGRWQSRVLSSFWRQRWSAPRGRVPASRSTSRIWRKGSKTRFERFCMSNSWLYVHSVPWDCWLGNSNGMRPVKSWMMVCWRW